MQLLFCPQAGSFDQKRLDALGDRLRAADYDVRSAPCGPRSSIHIAEEVADLAVMGGDGTIRHALQAMRAQHRTPRFLISPAGTINLLARDLRDDEGGSANARRCFIADIGGIPLVNCASLSPDSLAVAWNAPWLKRCIGRFSYAVTFLAVLIRWKRPRILLGWTGGTLSCEAVYIAKSRYYAGAWSVAPDARSSMPMLHVVALKRCRRRDYLHFAISTILGLQPAAASNVVRFRCKKLELDADETVPLQVDGDVVGSVPVRIAIDPEPIMMALL